MGQIKKKHMSKNTAIIAHRGGTSLAPENSLEGLFKAHKIGVSIVEIDIRATKEGQLVLMHDATVNRTTNGHGKVNQMTSKELRPLQLTNSERVPTLTEALRIVKNKCIVKVDIKEDGIEHDVLRTLQKHGMIRQAIIAHSLPTVLLRMKSGSPYLRTELSGFRHRNKKNAFIKKALRGRANIISPHLSITDRELVNEIHSHGMEVHVWTVNRMTDIRRMMRLGVDAITTDRPERAV